MFDLNKAVAEWKRTLRKYESFEDGAIMELESHLLDEFDKQKQSGLADEEAFAMAAAAVGRPEDVGGEYFKDGRRSRLAVPSWQGSRFSPALLLNYLKVALRNFRRYRGYSLINILGLAIGMACSLLIVLWVLDESGFDTFHKNGKDIYRVTVTGKFGSHFSSPAPLAPAVLTGIPEVAAAVRIHDMPRVTFQHEKRVFYEENGITADASLFKIFSFPLLQGDVDSALAAPDAIILSSRMARKYFGADDPIGKTLKIEGGAFTLHVTGIMADIPRRSHFRFDYVLSFRFLDATPLWGMAWGDFNFKTYIQARPQRNEAALVGKLNEVAFTHLGPNFRKQAAFSIQRLSDIYLNPIGPYDIPLGDRTRVFLFSLVALLIVLIAGVNFINLSTARAEKRAKEIGMRKVVGADRRQIIAQFFGESLLITLLSLPLAVLLVAVAMPHFNQLTGKEFAVRALAPGLLWGLAGIACVIAFLAGAFPALYLSSIRPTSVLKNGPFRSESEGRRSWVKRGALRRILVTSQFAVTITLILATLVVGSQLRLLRQKNWHLDRDQIITIPIKENIGKKYDRVRSELLADRAIVGVAAKDWLPTGYGTRNDTNGVTWEGKTEDQKNILMGTTQVDADYFATMGMRIIAGRGFSAAFPGDRQAAYVLDEQAVRSAGLEDAVGKSFAVGRRKGTIVGVVKNTVFHSLRQEPRPKVFYMFDDLAADGAEGTVFIRVQGGTPLPAAIAHIRKVWNRVNSYAPFEYHFLDQQIAAQYGSEQRLGKLFATFAILAVFISCLGLFGLVSFVAERRTKEIGIRKVLGASVPEIIALLTREFAKQVLLANMLAWPLAYFLLGKWLQGFVYRIAIGAGLFLFSGLLVLVLALLTASFQAVKAARMNPTRSLRYE